MTRATTAPRLLINPEEEEEGVRVPGCLIPHKYARAKGYVRKL